MNKIKNCMLLVLLLSLIGNVYADLDKTSAIALSLDSILEESIGKVNIYIYPNQITKNTNVAFIDHIAEAPYNQNWVIFIDDNPTFGWNHPCRYLFIDPITEEYSFVNETIFPLNFSEYDKISSMIMPEISQLEMLPRSTTESRPVNEHLYAVLINGTPNPDGNFIRFWNNLSAMYCTLTDHYGVPEENIYVHSTDATPQNNFSDWERGLNLDGDSDDDILLPSNQESIVNSFNVLANDMDSNDKLFVFTTGHGERDNGATNEGVLRLWGVTTDYDNYLLSNELDDMLDLINCEHITIVMSQCYSGSFIHGDNPITGDNRTIITSVDTDELACSELYLTISDEDDGFGYDEFVYYWTSAIRGCYPVRVNDNNVWKNKPWIDSDVAVGAYPFQEIGIDEFENHPVDYTPPTLNGEPTLYGAFEYADNWDTLTGFGDPSNYHNPNTDYDVLNSTNRTPQYYPNNNFHKRQTLSNMNLTFSDQYTLTEDMVVTNKTINIENDFTIPHGKSLLLENNSTLNINSHSLSLSNSILSLTNSNLTVNDANIELREASSLNITDNSSFTTSGICWLTGNTSYSYYDPATNYELYGVDILVPGDRIVVENSYINLGENTSLSGDTLWDGLYMYDCNNENETSLIKSNMNNLQKIIISNSNLEFSNNLIENCGQMAFYNCSDVYAENVDYIGNNFGIYSEESTIELYNCKIENNGTTGLCITNSGNAIVNYINSTKIMNNLGRGVQVRNAFVSISGSSTNPTTIENNNLDGFVGFGPVNSYFESNILIKNNGGSEIIGTENGFPYFMVITASPSTTIIDDNNDGGLDKYLLMLLGDGTRNCCGVNIDFSNQERFYPSFSNFSFPIIIEDFIEDMFRTALMKVSEKNFLEARDELKVIISDYPSTSTAEKALVWLPFVEFACGGELSELLQFIEDTDSEISLLARKDAESTAMIVYKNYLGAIEKLEYVINNPPSDEKKLLAELDQAFCYYKANLVKADKLPQNISYMPKNATEYKEIYNTITNKIMTINDDFDTDTEISPVPSLSNYPNPFNPETNIAFTLSNESNVKLSIYNLKGQKVKSLISSRFTKGQHSIIWNGRDNNNSDVSSGIYFYKLETDSKTITKKMILMK
jgi:hypothetical protein